MEFGENEIPPFYPTRTQVISWILGGVCVGIVMALIIRMLGG